MNGSDYRKHIVAHQPTTRPRAIFLHRSRIEILHLKPLRESADPQIPPVDTEAVDILLPHSGHTFETPRRRVVAAQPVVFRPHIDLPRRRIAANLSDSLAAKPLLRVVGIKLVKHHHIVVKIIHTPEIRSDPHPTVAVGQQRIDRIVRNRVFVEIIMRQMACQLILHNVINIKPALRGYPHLAPPVKHQFAHIRHLTPLVGHKHRFPHSRMHINHMQPLTLRGNIYLVTAQHYIVHNRRPEIALAPLVFKPSDRLHIVVGIKQSPAERPYPRPPRRVVGHTVNQPHCRVTPVVQRRQPSALLLVTIHPVCVDHKYNIPLSVNRKLLHLRSYLMPLRSLHIKLRQPLRYRVIDKRPVVAADPYQPVAILIERRHKTASLTLGSILAEILERHPVEAVKPVLRTEPQKPLPVLQRTVHRILRQPVLNVIVPEIQAVALTACSPHGGGHRSQRNHRPHSHPRNPPPNRCHSRSNNPPPYPFS